MCIPSMSPRVVTCEIFLHSNLSMVDRLVLSTMPTYPKFRLSSTRVTALAQFSALKIIVSTQIRCETDNKMTNNDTATKRTFKSYYINNYGKF